MAGLDTATAAKINDTTSATRGALNATYAGSMRSIQQYRSLVDSFGSNWAPAINAAIADAANGETIDFRQNDGLNGYQVTEGITVTKPSLRFLGRPRDGYALAIRCITPGVTVFTVKAGGVVFEDLAILGDGGVNGAGATVNGIDYYGTNNADVDSAFRGSTVQWCAVGVRVRGRNARFTDGLFSNNLRGIVFEGMDGTYHNGPSANSGNRGSTVENSRFHNTGVAAIDITTTAKIAHAKIAGNYFDSNGNGVHVRAIGTSASPHEKITFRDNKSTETASIVYALTYVNNSTIDGADIMGNAATPSDANAFEFNNCNTLTVRNAFGVQISGSGVRARNCTSLIFSDIAFRVVGMGSGPVGHGFDIDSTNTLCDFDDLRVENADGWGFTGSPTNSKLGRTDFRSCVLGQINSTTLRSEESELGAKYVAKKERVRPLGVMKTLVDNGSHPGFPYAITAPDGNIVLAYREGANHAPSKGVIKVARYTQGGAVVQAPTTVSSEATYDARDSGLTVLADGRIALTYFIWDQLTEVPLLDACRVMFSSDNGATWSAPVVIDSAFTTWSAAAGAIVQLANGHLLLPTYGVSAGQSFQHAHVSRSTDGGATWAPLGVIANGDTQGSRHYQEPNIILTDRGDLLALIRSDTALAHYKSRSSDGGATWTAPVLAFPGNGAPRITNHGGFLHAVHRHETTGRTVKISSGDSGDTWGNQIVLPIVGSYATSSYGVAMAYGKDSLRYFYAMQSGANNVATGLLHQVDSIVPEDRTAPGPVTCRVRMSASTQVNSATWTSLPFPLEDHDTDGMHNTVTNNSRISPQTPGYYMVKGTVYLAASPAGTPSFQFQTRVIKNGTAGIPGLREKKHGVAEQDGLVTVSDVVYLGVGDYIQLQAYQDSGAALSARIEDTTFSAALVGALV